jgi:hypothetical protein
MSRPEELTARRGCRPFAAHELSVPAQKRLRRYHQSMTSPPREQAPKRGKERAISRPEWSAQLLPSKHGQLMSQHQ